MNTSLFSEPERKPVRAIFVGLLNLLTKIDLSLLAGVVIGWNFVNDFVSSEQIILIICFVVVAAIYKTVITWRNETFHLDNQDSDLKLFTNAGALTKSEVVIPARKVRNVSIDEPWNSRIFGLVTLNIETIGGASPEFSWIIEKNKAEALRDLLAPKSDIQIEPQTIVKLSNKEILKLSFTSILTGVIIIVALAEVASRIARWIWGFERDSIFDYLNTNFSVIYIIPAAILVLFLAVLSSLISSYTRYLKLRVRYQDGLIKVEEGFFSRKYKNVLVDSIKSSDFTQGPIMRRLGLFYVNLVPDGNSFGAGVIRFPANQSQVDVIKSILNNNLDLVEPGIEVSPQRRISQLSLRRTLRNIVVGCVAVVSLSSITLYLWKSTYWGLLSIPICAVLSVIYYLLSKRYLRLYRWDYTDSQLLFKMGSLVVENKSLSFKNIQKVSVSRSIFERRNGLASLRVSSTGFLQDSNIELIPLSEAESVRDFILYKIEST